MNKYLQEVRRALLPQRRKDKAGFLAGYMNTRLPLLGLDMPTQRKIARRGFSFFRLPAGEIDAIWDAIWKEGKEFEVLSQALLYYQARRPALGLSDWRFLKTWVQRIDNWAHSDQLSDLYACLYERHPQVVYPVYKRWNRGKRPWAVRQSLVGMFYYAQARHKQPAFAKVLAMVKGAFTHPDLYVQKGVGWTLRELYNVYPERTYLFLCQRVGTLSAVAWQAATEKLSLKEKQHLKVSRKQV